MIEMQKKRAEKFKMPLFTITMPEWLLHNYLPIKNYTKLFKIEHLNGIMLCFSRCILLILNLFFKGVAFLEQ